MIVNLILDKLSKTRIYLREMLGRFTIIDRSILNELESVLIQADLGVDISNMIVKEIEKRRVCDREEVYSITRNVLINILSKNNPALNRNPDGPTVILVHGVNGSGKTTSIAKLAYRFKMNGNSVLLAAGDTFRAGAIEQLEIWADKIGVDVVKHIYRADPSAVCFDAMKAAISRKIDYLIIDTAGRFHTRVELMDELKKIDRTLSKHYQGTPHERLLVIDATTGQNGLIQAREFHSALNITGIIVTKLDGTAKGGILVNIHKELGLPIKFIGVGQELEDLLEFDPINYVSAII